LGRSVAGGTAALALEEIVAMHAQTTNKIVPRLSMKPLYRQYG
jgi:hypothetical protein